jgi:hypothetical protein
VEVERTNVNNTGESQNGPYLEYLFPELHNIYLSPDINSVSELYGKRLYLLSPGPVFWLDQPWLKYIITGRDFVNLDLILKWQNYEQNRDRSSLGRFRKLRCELMSTDVSHRHVRNVNNLCENVDCAEPLSWWGETRGWSAWSHPLRSLLRHDRPPWVPTLWSANPPHPWGPGREYEMCWCQLLHLYKGQYQGKILSPDSCSKRTWVVWRSPHHGKVLNIHEVRNQ